MEHFLSSAGYGAVILLAFVEACCVPIPSEVTFGFAGFLAYQGRLNLALIIILGTLAELAGSYVGYAIGRRGGRPLVDRLGRYVLLTNADLDRAERWLSGRGEFAILVGRALPILRSFTSIVAGIAEMPAIRFGVFSLIGTFVYVTAVSSAGYALGSAWHRVAHDFSLAGVVVAVVVVAVVVFFFAHRLSAVRRERRLVGEAARTDS